MNKHSKTKFEAVCVCGHDHVQTTHDWVYLLPMFDYLFLIIIILMLLIMVMRY